MSFKADPSLFEPSDETPALANTLTVAFCETMKQKICPGSQNCGTKNVFYARLVVICCAAIDN